MKNSILILALVLAMPNIYAVQRQENMTAAAENAHNRAAAQAENPARTVAIPFHVKQRTTVIKKKATSLFQRVKNKFASTPVAENTAQEQEAPNNAPETEPAESASTSSTAQAQDAPAPSATPVEKEEPTVQAQAGYTTRAMQTLASYKPIMRLVGAAIVGTCAGYAVNYVGSQVYQAYNPPVVYPTYWVNSLIPSWPVQLS